MKIPCLNKVNVYKCRRAATRGKTGKTTVLPIFFGIEVGGGSGDTPMWWPPMWWSCLPKIYDGGPEWHLKIDIICKRKVPIWESNKNYYGFSWVENIPINWVIWRLRVSIVKEGWERLFLVVFDFWFSWVEKPIMFCSTYKINSDCWISSYYFLNTYSFFYIELWMSFFL